MSEAIDTRSPREILADAVIQYADDCGLQIRLPEAPIFPQLEGPDTRCNLFSLSRPGPSRDPLPLDARLQLRLPADHSAWAQSVRWSCGRPGYVPVFDWRAERDRAVCADYARYWLSATIIRADRLEFFRISAV